MSYIKQTWADAPSTSTPLSAARLTHMEDGIAAADGAAVAASTAAAAAQSTADDAASAALAAQAAADSAASAASGAAADAAAAMTSGEVSAAIADSGSDVRTALNDWFAKASPISFTVTIPAGKVSENLAGFPVYINLADMPDAFWDKVAVGGGGIRCHAGTVELPREVVSCDPVTKAGELHVKADLSNTVDTTILITVDGVSADYADTDPFGRNAVWSDYAGVWHLGETSGPCRDSTGNGLDSANVLATQRGGVGKLGGDTVVTTGSDRIEFGNVLNIGTGDLALAIWINTSEAFAALQVIVAKNPDSGVNNGYQAGINPAGKLYGQFLAGNDGAVTATSPVTTVNDGTWHLLHFVYDRAGNLSVYNDGQSVAAASMASMVGKSSGDTSGSLGISAFGAGLIGSVDEFRVRRSVPSPARIAAEYANQNNPASFYDVTVGDGGEPGAVGNIDGGNATSHGGN